MSYFSYFYYYFFFNDTATTEIYTLSLHDALPIYGMAAQRARHPCHRGRARRRRHAAQLRRQALHVRLRSEEHTSELQSRQYLVCRLLLEKKNTKVLHNVIYNKIAYGNQSK